MSGTAAARRLDGAARAEIPASQPATVAAPQSNPARDVRESARPSVSARPTQPGAALASPSVKITGPQAALERRRFDQMLQRLGLASAAADGVITEAEARNVGVALSWLEKRAERSGDATRIDSYAELAGASAPVAAKKPAELLRAGADYLVIAPKARHDELTPLLNHRSLQGLRVALVDPADISAHYGQTGAAVIARFAKELYQRGTPKLRYLALIGEAQDIPTFRESRSANGHSYMSKPTYVSDNRFGDVNNDGTPEIAVGRLPISSDELLETTIDKLLRCETAPSGPWQSRMSVIDGDPAWSGTVNRAANWIADQEVSAAPADREVRRVSFNPASPIGGHHDAMVREELERGGLYVAYVGHGTERWVDGMVPNQVASIHPEQGAPFVTLTACLTGSFDSGESLTEALVEGDGPAVASIGASEVSMPHSNAAWARILGQEVAHGRGATVGDVFLTSKRRFADGEDGGLAGVLNGLGNLAMGDNTRLSHLYLYNLIGDPATPLRRPSALGGLRAPSRMDAGRAVNVAFQMPAGATTAYVTFERPTDEQPLPHDEDDTARLSVSARAANARAYNDRSAAVISAPIVGGRLGALVLPPNMQGGSYNMRVTVVGVDGVAAGVVEGVFVRQPLRSVG
jgi:hypothetical protein